MEERRHIDTAPASISSRNSSAIENARRFLYDEDEPPIEHPATARVGVHTNLSGAGEVKQKNRLSPMMATYMGTLTATWNKIKHTPRGRLLVLASLIVGIFMLVLLFTSRENAGTQRWELMKKINKEIIAAGLSSKTVLQAKNSPQYKAVRWLAHVDEASPDDQFLLQRYAMAVLFYSTSGTGWKDNTNWMTDKGYCSWFGVECAMKSSKFDGNDEITKLDMPENLLKGSLPSEIRSLSNLIALDFTDNALMSTLPTELLSMNSLNYLLLGKNQLQGTLPENYWDTANQLRELDLGHNEFHGTLPSMLLGLTEMRKLGLEYNQFDGELPNAVAGLKRLCKYLIDYLGTLVFDLSHVPYCSTAHLYLQGNAFAGSLPPDLFSMTTLIDLRLSENRFIGTIPIEFSQLFRMENLHLSDNQFTGTIPPALFGQLTRLMELSVAKNELQGSLPTTLGHLLDLSKSRPFRRSSMSEAVVLTN